MTFTELEVVLMLGLGVVLYVNHYLLKKLNMHREAHGIMLNTIGHVADRKAVFVRDKDGVIHVEKLNPLEKHNEVRV